MQFYCNINKLFIQVHILLKKFTILMFGEIIVKLLWNRFIFNNAFAIIIMQSNRTKY